MNHVARARRPRVAWRNGGGTTAVLWATGDGPLGFGVRISVARIEVNGEFSHFSGVTRYQRVLQGAGFELTGEGLLIDVGHHLVRYSGAVAVYCRLVDGPVDVVNVMIADGVAAEVREVPAGTEIVGLAVLLEATGVYAAGDLIHADVSWRCPVPVVWVNVRT